MRTGVTGAGGAAGMLAILTAIESRIREGEYGFWKIEAEMREGLSPRDVEFVERFHCNYIKH
jgi:hypothetical protein